jgi:hypothetical protein
MTVILFYTPYLLSCYWIIIFIKRYFPSREISRSFGWSFKATIIISAVISLFILAGLIYNIVELSNGDRSLEEPNPLYWTLLAMIAIILLFQIYNSIEGIRLLRIIRKNARNELINSF